MITGVYGFFKRLTNARNLWISGFMALGLTIVMLVLKLPDNIASAMGYSGSQGMFGLDAQAFSNPDTLYATLSNYGEKGREVYAYTSILFDIAYPISYTIFLVLGFTALLSRMLPSSSKWQMLSLIFILGGTFDLLENFSFYTLIANYPKRLDWLAQIANVFTNTKVLIAYPGLIGLAVLWVVFLLKGTRRVASSNL